MRFERGDDRSLAKGLRAIFGHPENPVFDCYARNPIRGKLDVAARECAITIGDFSYVRVSNGREGRQFVSGIVVSAPCAQGAALTISTGWANRELQTSGGSASIDIESDEFNQRFCVTGDPRFAFDVLHPRMLIYLLEVSPPPLIRIAAGLVRITGNDVTGDAPWQVDDFRKWLAWSRNFLELWPEHLKTSAT